MIVGCWDEGIGRGEDEKSKVRSKRTQIACAEMRKNCRHADLHVCSPIQHSCWGAK